MDSMTAMMKSEPVSMRTKRVAQKVRHIGHLAIFATTEAIACGSPR